MARSLKNLSASKLALPLLLVCLSASQLRTVERAPAARGRENGEGSR
jgi:hypothetical protein